jgi:hypothetical protein
MTACQNGNLFGRFHDTGESGDINTLLSDAEIALRDRNYSQALSLYERILAQDSDNAEALYGAASAAIGSSGLNFAQIISNILAQTGGAPSINGLGSYINAAGESFTSQAASNSILNGVDLAALDNVIDTAICRLQKIVSGNADGSISQNDVATVLNFGSLCLIRGVLRALRSDFFDVTNTNGTYSVTPNVDFNTFCGDSANDAVLFQIARDVVGAYALFNRAVNLLNLQNNEIILQLRNDIDSVVVILLTDGGPNALPTACINKLGTIGITVGNFRNNLEAFLPPSSC